MNRRTLLVALAMLTPVLAPASSQAQDQPVKRTVLQQAEISGIAGHESVLYRADVAPGGAAPKHTHPGDEMVYVAEGSIVIEPVGKEPIPLKAGESIRIPMGTVHSAHNPDSSAGTVLIVFLVTEAGKPLASAAE